MDPVVEIQRLKYRYARTLDTKSWTEFADTMLPDATATYGANLAFESRAALIEFMKTTLGPSVITEHHCGHPEIEVDGGVATGVWYLSDTVIIPEHQVILRGAAFYRDRYVRCEDGAWRIAHTGYERTYEYVVSTNDVPSFHLTANMWSEQ
ncbi:nuclear transport factor 2 family protein [Rhodococcoides yunnanense]|uniref:nuclear transport factor 2 family protein n=1 Tax=Rhodococcoides yunnanense TaxID=278209 RepID=UPI00093401E4|nr:nuclear transport factor 2 family protein [Rhodococcus yunnanensis]